VLILALVDSPGEYNAFTAFEQRALFHGHYGTCNTDTLAGTPGPGIPHALFHYDVITDGDTPYQGYRLCFASAEIEQRISTHIATHDMSDIIRWMMSLQSDTVLGPLLGHFYEMVAHRILCSGGTFKFARLHERAAREELRPLTFDRLVMKSVRSFSDILPADKERVGVYWKFPITHRAFDSYFSVNIEHEVHHFNVQITCAESHPINARGIKAAREFWEPRGINRKILWVVPKNRYGAFTWQPFQRGTESLDMTHEQYVIELDFES